MSKSIARLLKTDIMADMDLKALAQILQKKGRGNDTILAHITAKEAKRLKRDGGSGTINPDTGLPEFDDYGADSYMAGSSYQAPSYQAAPDYSAQPQTQVEPSGGGYDPVNQTGGYTYSADPYASPNAPYAQTSASPNMFAESGGAPVRGQIAPNYGGGKPVTSENISYPSMTAAAGAVPDYSQGAPVPAAPPGQEKTGMVDKLSKALGIDPENLAKYGLAGAQGLVGMYQSNKAANQARKAKEEQMQMASPYQTKGKELMGQAERGELSQASQQQLQAAQAQVNQGVEARGGVGAAQANAQIAALRDQLLNQQFQLGLQISGIGDQIAQGAIKTGIQADQYVNNLTSNYFTNMARILGGSSPQIAQQTPSNYGANA